jgi:hypothetical protein
MEVILNSAANKASVVWANSGGWGLLNHSSHMATICTWYYVNMWSVLQYILHEVSCSNDHLSMTVNNFKKRNNTILGFSHTWMVVYIQNILHIWDLHTSGMLQSTTVCFECFISSIFHHILSLSLLCPDCRFIVRTNPTDLFLHT